MKKYILIECSSIGISGYNEAKNNFEWLSIDNASRYTKDEALEMRSKLLEPRIEQYQSKGKNYQEIHLKRLTDES